MKPNCISIIHPRQLCPWFIALAGIALVAAQVTCQADEQLFRPDPVVRTVVPPVIPTFPFGQSYADWSAKWWQWSFSFPANADPALGTANLSAGQHGPVWFLPSPLSPNNSTNTVVIQGTVPEGIALFGSVLSTWSDNSGCPTFSNFTEAELRANNSNNWSVVSKVSCTIDGVAVAGMDDPIHTSFRVQSPAFAYTLAVHDNLLAALFDEPCIDGGTTIFPAVADGVYVMINPLPPGPHTIHFVGIVGPISAPFVEYDITFKLTVQPDFHNR